MLGDQEVVDGARLSNSFVVAGSLFTSEAFELLTRRMFVLFSVKIVLFLRSKLEINSFRKLTPYLNK